MRKTAIALAAVAALGATAAAAHADVGVGSDECSDAVVSVAPGDGAPGVFVSLQPGNPGLVWVYADNGDGELDRGNGDDEFDETTYTGDPNCAGEGSDGQLY